MPKKKSIICLAVELLKLNLLKKLKQENYFIFLIDKNKNCVGKKYSDIFINCSTSDYKSITLKLKKFRNEYKFIALFNQSSGLPVLSSCYLCERLGINYLKFKYAKKILFKSSLLKLCKKKKILIPDFINKKKITNPKKIVILKPSLPYKGKINTIKTSFGKISKKIERVKKNSIDGKAIVQEFIDGFDVTAYGFIKNYKINILSIFQENNFFDNQGNLSKSFLINPSSKVKKSKITNQINNIIKKVKINNCPLSISFRVKKNKLYLIEIHTDLCGDNILSKLLTRSIKNIDPYLWVIKMHDKTFNFSLPKKIFYKKTKITLL